jgi:hypothetical protein
LSQGKIRGIKEIPWLPSYHSCRFYATFAILQRNSPAAPPTGKSYAPKEAFRKFPYTPFFDPLPEARNPIQKNPKAAVKEAVQ